MGTRVWVEQQLVGVKAVAGLRFEDLAVPRDRVVVKVVRGWVTLTGRVDLEYQKSCAEADARLTPGVLGVTNEIDRGYIGFSRASSKRRGNSRRDATIGPNAVIRPRAEPREGLPRLVQELRAFRENQ